MVSLTRAYLPTSPDDKRRKLSCFPREEPGFKQRTVVQMTACSVIGASTALARRNSMLKRRRLQAPVAGGAIAPYVSEGEIHGRAT
jgi:hypothetical protein